MRHRTLNCAQADRNVMPSQWHSAHKIAVASVLAELPGKALGMLGQAASPRWRLIELPAIHAQVSSHGVAAAAQLVGDPIGVPAKRCRLRVASTPSSACIACLQSTRLDRGTWSNTLPSLLACGHEEVLYTTVLSSRRHGYHDNCSYHYSESVAKKRYAIALLIALRRDGHCSLRHPTAHAHEPGADLPVRAARPALGPQCAPASTTRLCRAQGACLQAVSPIPAHGAQTPE
jgi:hypothetical protein